MQPKEEKRIKEYLGNKLSEGGMILFTGAGFSSEAKDKNGRNLPLSKELAKELCDLINLEYSPGDSLKDIFQAAVQKKKKEVSRHLKERLTADPRSLDSEYKTVISQPWHKAYTVNVDSLFEAAQAQFNFDRRIFCLSGNAAGLPSRARSPKDLIVVHLHGMLEDIPDHVTFSHEQYFEKTFSDPLYSILSSEILQYPFLFLGSQLDEELFWRYIRLRKLKGSIRDFGELRPNSLLVIPELSPVRQELLREYNITWIPQTRKEFCARFLAPLKAESQKGLIKIKQFSRESEPTSVPSVSHLMSLEKGRPSKSYLLGSEPSWKDIYSHSAERDKESEWMDKISAVCPNNNSRQSPASVFAFTGTAGDGKTSIAMRTAAQMTNKGKTVGWIDRDSNIAPHKILSLVENSEGMEYLFIDTPDIYGPSISQTISELALRSKLKAVFLAVRGGKADRLFQSPLFDKSIPFEEFSTYRLTDNEINKILDLLEDKNLLGSLKGKSREEQAAVFKSKSDRQLIVAMIEVTSGKNFTEKICGELEDLDGVSKQVYCLAAVAASRNHYLLREEILLGMRGDKSNNILNTIERMVRRGLLVESAGNKGLKVRHKVIAEKIAERLALQKQLMPCYTCLAYIAAIKSAEPTSEQKRMKRLLKTLINHDFLFKISSDPAEVQGLYESIEDFLTNDHHFWLQRGCFELENGSLNLARNYLNQSQSLNSEDPLVILSMEHLNFKEAVAGPSSEKSFILAKEAYENIVRLIERRGKLDPYPYHILGAQGLKWAKQGIKNPDERKKYLEGLLNILKEGAENHKLSNEIKDIKDKVQKEILHFFVKN